MHQSRWKSNKVDEKVPQWIKKMARKWAVNAPKYIEKMARKWMIINAPKLDEKLAP